MLNIFLIAVGGAFGSILRYLSCEAITNFSKTNNFLLKFPLGTFFVNISGSMLAGILYYFIIKNFDQIDLRFKNFLLVGILGGYTTFSAFSLDVFRLAISGNYLQSLVYAVSSLIFAIMALIFAFYLCKIIFS